MSNLELRWILPEGTTTCAPILQYRDDQMFTSTYEKRWITVQCVFVDKEEYQSAQRS